MHVVSTVTSGCCYHCRCWRTCQAAHNSNLWFVTQSLCHYDTRRHARGTCSARLWAQLVDWFTARGVAAPGFEWPVPPRSSFLLQINVLRKKCCGTRPFWKLKLKNRNLNWYIFHCTVFEHNESCVLWVWVHAACIFIFPNILSPLKEQRSLHN